MINYIFDVDGTLTPSRRRMDREFEAWFEHFATHNNVYYVTGSDRAKTIEQLGPVIYNLAVRAYQCSGNDVWSGSEHVSSKEIWLPQGLLVELDKILHKSKFYVKSGQHIDYRPGLVNFSIIGRRCTLEERVMYRQWDEHKNEREKISNFLSKKFPKYNFQVAGETGIDITVKGSDKSQILQDFNKHDQIYFFGDMCHLGGNDYEIANAVNELSDGKTYHVSSWEETWSILKELA